MLEILRGNYNVVFLSIFLGFLLLHRKRSTEERKKEVMKLLIFIAVWTTFVVWLNVTPQGSAKLVSAGAAATSERTFLSKIP